MPANTMTNSPWASGNRPVAGSRALRAFAGAEGTVLDQASIHAAMPRRTNNAHPKQRRPPAVSPNNACARSAS